MFDIKDSDGKVVVEDGRRITARHIRQLEKSGAKELQVPYRLNTCWVARWLAI